MRSGVIIVLALVIGATICFLPLSWFGGSPLLTIDSNRADSDQLSAFSGIATLYVTLSPECPISKAYMPSLNQLHSALLDKRVELIGIIPGAVAADTDVDDFRNRFRIQYPIVLDHTNRLCSQLPVTHMPQAVLVNTHGNVVYSGRIDDRFVRIAAAQREVREESLKVAIRDYLSGKLETPRYTEPIGCQIEALPSESFAATPEQVTFASDVAPIIFENCSRCHRAAAIAPFSLLTYAETVRHAQQIKQVVQQGLMPPWKPTAEFGHLQYAQRITEAQKSTIIKWVDSGMPGGRPEDLPPLPVFTDGWQLGPPDLELVMPESFEVPADGSDIYQHFIIPTGLTEDRMVSAVEFRPGNPEVVHHAFTYFDITGKGRELDAQEPGPGYSRIGSPGFAVTGSLGGWGPGGSPKRLPPGMGRPLAEHADLVLQIHYHPCGRVVRDQSRIGLYFAEPKVTKLVRDIMVSNVNLTIPANEAKHEHVAEWTLPVDTIVLGITPHMHVLGKSIHTVAIQPDGTQVPLIRIDDWDFYWQDDYVFKRPIELPAGTRIAMQCVFDNSADNPLNPNSPPKTVYWGDFSDDEMGICYLPATTRTYGDYVKLNEAASKDFHRQWDEYQAQKQKRETVAPDQQ